ncbi:hypothetical protein CDL15_Pgr024670 [Punica granatum]|uniref:Uncharacterized protein n=1 Tax=Punica granatum TaxID=22663 RepID=A0A218W483_PUNGR|nr:hypothetical protein CDL15_Pgr024670 [Punica granatum]PKI36447.1 hypothetical protein CRG98_043155 [Punica granatum]
MQQWAVAAGGGGGRQNWWNASRHQCRVCERGDIGWAEEPVGARRKSGKRPLRGKRSAKAVGGSGLFLCFDETVAPLEETVQN